MDWGTSQGAVWTGEIETTEGPKKQEEQLFSKDDEAFSTVGSNATGPGCPG